MSGRIKFSRKLLNHIDAHRNNEVKAMLNEHLVKASDKYGTLLHYAVSAYNGELIRYLIKMESNVNSSDNRYNYTPLMLAVKCNYVAGVKVLLEAGADINIANSRGESAYHLVFDPYTLCPITEAFIDKVRADTSSVEQFVELLLAHRGSLYHAACSRDIEVIKCMLNQGFDISYPDEEGQTALHAAVELNDLNLAKWLADNGADVNARDEYRQTPLYVAASCGNKIMLQLLLDHRADANVELDIQSPLLFATFACSRDGVTEEQYVECAECLLQYCAIPRNQAIFPKIFHLAFLRTSDKRLRLLTCHLAMLEMLDNLITQSAMYCRREVNQLIIMADYKKYYKLCQRVLAIVMCDKLSLIELLNMSESKMKFLVCNETFTSKIKGVCTEHKLSKLYPYYYNTLLKHISKARQTVELEEAAIKVISQLLQGDVNVYYQFARKVICYLSKLELEQLLRVYE